MNVHPQREPSPRGTQADGVQGKALYLIKYCSVLRATYQIKLLAYNAKENGMLLALVVRRACRFHPSLEELIRTTGNLIQRVDCD